MYGLRFKEYEWIGVFQIGLMDPGVSGIRFVFKEYMDAVTGFSLDFWMRYLSG